MEGKMMDIDTVRAEAKIAGGDAGKDRSSQGKFDNLVRHRQNGGQGSKSGEKNNVGSDRPSLRNVLSDPLTGLLMDDAMVAQCGHSFGLRSLQRVLETNLCISCGALVPPESLIPNYALRAAVEAYGREELMSRKVLQGVSKQQQNEQPEVPGCKIVSKTSLAQLNCSDDDAEDGYHSKGNQDSFLVDDCVKLKGNKTTPGHSICREEVTTAQCLDGWNMVKTVDGGESIRVLNHSLQKVGENDMAVDPESGSCLDQLRHVTPKIDPSDANRGEERTLNDQTTTKSFHELRGDQDESKFLGIHVYGFECENSEGDKGVSGLGKVPSESNHEGGGGNIYLGTNQFSPEGTSGYSGSHTDIGEAEGSKKQRGDQGVSRSGEVILESNHDGGGGDVCLATNHFSPEGASGHSEADTDIGETKRSKRGRGGDGPQGRGILGTQAGLDVLTVRSKRSSLISRASNKRSGSLSSSGPYRKAFISGARKRSCTGNGTTYFPLVDKTREASSTKTAETKERGDAECDVSNPGTIQMEALHMIKKGMGNLEKDIPWICFHRVWRRQRSFWRKGLRESSTLQELGIKLQELRSSLLLASAGGMPDEEWEKQLNTAKNSENTDLLKHLWRNFNDDVSKWMTAKAKRSQVHLNKRIEDDEYSDLKKLFPTLVIEGFSPVGVTAAAAIAAAEAFSPEDSKNTEVLLKVPMKLIRQHNHHDLIVLREALEREKRHISAKLAVLETKEYKYMNGFGESAGSDQSMDTKPFKISKHDRHTMDESIISPPSFEFHENAILQELQPRGNFAKCKSIEHVMNGTGCKSS